MDKNLLNAYKFPILISITLFIVLLALTVARDPLVIATIFLGTILGAVALDIDYFVYAYFFEPEKEFSKHIRAYTKDKDIKGALLYILHHKNEIHDKVLNSALFQIALGALIIVTTSYSTPIIFKAFALSVFVNSLYRMAEEYFEGRLDQWFWAFKNKPSTNNFYIYSCCMLAILIFTLSIF